jgi:hypothetical protein
MEKLKLLLGTRITGSIIEWSVVVWINLSALLLIVFTTFGEFVRNADIGGFLLMYLFELFIWFFIYSIIRSNLRETLQPNRKSKCFPCCDSLWSLRTFNITFEVVHLGVFLAFLSVQTQTTTVVACLLRTILLVVFVIGSVVVFILRQCKTKVVKEYQTLSQTENREDSLPI